MATVYTAIAENKRRSLLVMIVFVMAVAGLGLLFSQASEGGLIWLVGAIGMSVGMAIFSFFYSDKVILGISGAKKIKKRDHPRLYRIVENLCLGLGLPRPEVYLINDSAPNALATGRDPQHAKIAVTTGLLNKLDDQELEGVVAHELSHIKNYDIRLMSIVVILIGVIVLLSDWFRRTSFRGRDRERKGSGVILIIAILASVLAPLFARLLKLALSRQREYLADADAALLTRYPEGLASALEKISADQEILEVANAATAHLYVADPLKAYDDRVARLFSTHPPVQERINRLRRM